MAAERLKKRVFQRDESFGYLESMLSRTWASGAKIYLICLGNLSRGDYRQLAKKFDTEVLATKSILGSWLSFISWILPGSYVGAMQMHSQSSAWAKQIVDLAGDGYVVLVMGNNFGIEQQVTEAVQSYSLPNSSGQFYDQFKNLDIYVVNAEDQNSVDIETNSVANDSSF